MSYRTHGFDEWLKERMRELGLRNQDVAEQVGVTGPAVSLWRSGVNVPSSERIAALAEILEVPPETVLIQLGRTKPRTGLSQDWEAFISQFEDADEDVEQLLFAIGDALLLERNRQHTETQIHLPVEDYLLPGDQPDWESLPSEWVLLGLQAVEMPKGERVVLRIAALSVGQDRYRVLIETDRPVPDPYRVYLMIHNARHVAQPTDAGYRFDDVELHSQIRSVRVVIE